MPMDGTCGVDAYNRYDGNEEAFGDDEWKQGGKDRCVSLSKVKYKTIRVSDQVMNEGLGARDD